MKQLRIQRDEEQKIVLQASIQAAAGSPVKLRNLGTKAQADLILGMDSYKMGTPYDDQTQTDDRSMKSNMDDPRGAM